VVKGATTDIVRLVVPYAANRIQLQVVHHKKNDADDSDYSDEGNIEVRLAANLQNNGEKILMISGLLGSDDVSTATIEAHMLDSAGNDSGQICARLRVMALPPRTVSLGIYRVQDPTSVDTLNVGGPTDAQIMAALNDIYQQAGIRFVLEGSSSPSADSPGVLNVNYDMHSAGLTVARDGRLQTDEFSTVIDQTAARPGQVKLFLARNSGSQNGDDNKPLLERLYARGETPGEGDFGPKVQSFVFTNTTGDDNIVALIAAHEIVTFWIYRKQIRRMPTISGRFQPAPGPMVL
jgi:hypothetical protein